MIRHGSSICIIDDHDDAREEMKAWLRADGRIGVLGEFDTLEEAESILKEIQPEAIVLELNQSEGNAMDFIRKVRTAWPSIGLLIYSNEDEIRYAERALRVGAHGYLMKGCPAETFLIALRTVIARDLYVSPVIENRILRNLANQSDADDHEPVLVLSNRELEVFVKIGQGVARRDIARELGLSVNTVETHLAQIKRKMKFQNLRELTKQAQEWVSLTTESTQAP